MKRIIYNTSFIIEDSLEEEWVAFMQTHYIDSTAVTSGLCKDIIFTKVSIDQPEGKTYSVQFIFENSKQMEHFINTYLPTIENMLKERYANRFVYFSSTLTEI